MSIWGHTRSAESLKQGILAKLRELGATRMEANYSGGNDEGGVDDVIVLRPTRKTDYLLHRVYTRSVWQDRQQVGVEEVTDTYPTCGPYSTKKEALAAARAKMKDLPPQFSNGFQPTIRFEPVKATEPLVRLFGVEGDYDDEGGLHNLVNELLELDFYTWAGEFSAHGTVFATVEDRRVWREGEMSTYSSDESGGEY